MERNKNREKISGTISVGALISFTHEIKGDMLCLVRKKDTKKWGLPSGGIIRLPSGRIETQQEALQREIWEETGMDVNLLNSRPKLLGNVLVEKSNGDYSIGVLFEIRLSEYKTPYMTVANSDGELDEIRFF